MPLFTRKPLPRGNARLACPKCGNVLLLVDYGPLKNPKKGKRAKGLFGTCIICGPPALRITSGHPQ